MSLPLSFKHQILAKYYFLCQPPSPGVKKPPIVSTSWSFTDNEPDTKYDHAWSIANFTKKMEMENGEELKSGVFSIRTKDRTTDWFMRINPNGEEKTCKGFVSLFLYKDGVCEVPINADIIFSIVDKDGTKTRAKRYVFICLYHLERFYNLGVNIFSRRTSRVTTEGLPSSCRTRSCGTPS